MRSYGHLKLTSTSPVQTWDEPLGLGEVIKFLELPTRDPEDYAELLQLGLFIAGARGQAEILQNQDLVRKQQDLVLDYFPYGCSSSFYWTSYQNEIELRAPLISVDLVQYRDSDGAYTTLTEGTDYIVDLERGIVAAPYSSSWPSFSHWPTSAVLVRFTSGYLTDDVFWIDSGSWVKIGMLQLISHWFTGRLPFETGAGAVAEYPFTVTHLLTSGAVPRVR